MTVKIITLGCKANQYESQAMLEALLAAGFTQEMCIRDRFIDEILKGTNTVERLAASQAVLEELHRRDCICVAATHDLELTQRLAGSYACYHFQETITGEGVIFDYKLRSGPSHTRNAIRLLNMLGFSQATVHLSLIHI